MKKIKTQESIVNSLIQFHWKIIFSVVEADILDHFSQQVYIVGQQSSLDVVAEHVTEYPAEIFAPRIREETSRIRQHTDEPAKQTHIREHIHLLGHPVLLVQEPPRRAVLHLAGH